MHVKKTPNSVKNSRFLPYHKTPLIRSTRLAKETPRIKRTDFGDICNKTWQSYLSTALNQFKCDEHSLKKYSKLLTEWVQSKLMRGSASKDNSSFKAEFTCKSDQYSTTVFITLKGSSLNYRQHSLKNRASYNAQTYFSAVMHSINGNPDTSLMDESQSMWFPVLLANGAVFTTNQVLEFMMETFDCVISELHFASHELEWMVALWQNVSEEEMGTKSLDLIYSISKQEISKIRYSLNVDNVNKLWDAIHGKQSNEVVLSEVKKLFEQLKQHFYFMFRINLDKLKLAAVGTPVLTANQNGKIKIFAEDEVGQILQHIISLNPLTLFS
ncbi:Centromere protein L [Nymphon striatum]|nr:Centromere protein L [Nymphon striatum]